MTPPPVLAALKLCAHVSPLHHAHLSALAALYVRTHTHLRPCSCHPAPVPIPRHVRLRLKSHCPACACVTLLAMSPPPPTPLPSAPASPCHPAPIPEHPNSSLRPPPGYKAPQCLPLFSPTSPCSLVSSPEKNQRPFSFLGRAASLPFSAPVSGLTAAALSPQAPRPKEPVPHLYPSSSPPSQAATGLPSPPSTAAATGPIRPPPGHLDHPVGFPTPPRRLCARHPPPCVAASLVPREPVLPPPPAFAALLR